MAETKPKPTLLVLAAGMGSRYGGLKQVDPVGVNGEAILDFSVFDAIRAGFGKVVFVIRRDIEEEFVAKVSTRFESHVAVDHVFQSLDDVPAGFTISPDREKPWGTGHAVRAARDAIAEPFAAINADDFYGREAYEKLAEFLSQDGLRSADCRNCMVGFQLKNTLSEHGKVARGICEADPGGMLVSVEEVTDIYKTDSGAENRSESGEIRKLTGEELVSMNMWGFPTDFFGHLEAALESFLAGQGQNPKAEMYIPTVVDDLIKRGEERVRMLSTKSAWFGVTYREDKPVVRAAIRALVGRGQYPASLWGSGDRGQTRSR